MKKKLLFFIPICLLIIFNTKVSALGVNFSISSSPSSTDKGSFIVTKVTVSGRSSSSHSVTYQFSENDNIELVGFSSAGNGNCTYYGSENKITCSNISDGTVAYPVFRITQSLSDDELLSLTAQENSTSNVTTADLQISKKKAAITVSNIDASSTKTSLLVGDTSQITVTITPSDAENQTLSYSSSDSTVATVSSSGLITAVSEGNATISVSCGTIVKTIEIKVQKEAINLTGIKASKSELKMKVGDKELITYTLEPTDATIDDSDIKYSSSNDKVAMIDSNKKIVAVGAGEATITISANGITDKVKVTVTGESSSTEETSGSNGGTILLTIIITAIVTVVIMKVIDFVKEMINNNNNKNNNRSSKNDNSDDEDYIYPDHDHPTSRGFRF